MNAVAHFPNKDIFWCPRCGTLKAMLMSERASEIERPKLVDRCREYRKLDVIADEWWRLGIEEAIHVPQDRRKTLPTEG